MHEYICKHCGYRQIEKDMMDYIGQGAVYPNFATNNVLTYMNPEMYTGQRTRCPLCGAYEDQSYMGNNVKDY